MDIEDVKNNLMLFDYLEGLFNDVATGVMNEEEFTDEITRYTKWVIKKSRNQTIKT